jgi:hypothetical protein
MQDFQVVDTIMYPKAGTALTPPHDYNDFKLKVYAPYGFRYLRRKFNVNELDFMNAIGETDLIEISNPGASGSVFYKTSNDKYILKTVQYQECEFLKTLLAGYALVTRLLFFFKILTVSINSLNKESFAKLNKRQVHFVAHYIRPILLPSQQFLFI